MRKGCLIYSLKCPISNTIRYIGKTIESLEKRLNRHIGDIKKSNHRVNWIKSLLIKGLKPEIELLEEVHIDDWIVAEKYWINLFRFWGFDLVNSCDGGQGTHGRKLSCATKLKIKNSLMGHIVSDKTRMKKRIKRIGYKLSQSTKDKISKLHKGKTRPLETGIKISKALTGKKRSIETRLKMSERMKGNIAPNKIAVEQYTKEGIKMNSFDSILSASRHMNITKSCICNNLSGFSKSAGGFIWKKQKTC